MRTIVYDENCLKRGLQTCGIKAPLFVYECIDSTNLEAFRKLETSNYSSVIILSRYQTCGRGNHGSVWEDNRGQLSLSVGFREMRSPETLSKLRIRLNERICKTLTKLFHQAFQLKAPNDILWQGKKLSGLLLESKLEHEQTYSWVLGFGMNVFHAKDNAWSHPIQQRAAILEDVVQGISIDINQLTLKLLNGIFEVVAQGE